MAEVILSKENLEYLGEQVKRIVHLLAEIENAKEDISEIAGQVKEKIDIPKAEVNRIAKAVYDESYIDKEREKLETLEDMLEALEGKL